MMPEKRKKFTSKPSRARKRREPTRRKRAFLSSGWKREESPAWRKELEKKGRTSWPVDSTRGKEIREV